MVKTDVTTPTPVKAENKSADASAVTKKPRRTYYEVFTEDKLIKAAAKLEKEKVVSLDLEIANWSSDKRYQGEIRLITITTKTDAYVIDLFKVKNDEIIKKIIKGKGIVGQNLKFDLNYIYRRFQVLPKVVFDTMIAAQVLSMRRHDIKYGLDHLVERYLGEKMDKKFQKYDWSQNISEMHLVYAANDGFSVMDLLDVFREKLNNKGNIDLTRKIYPELIDYFGIDNPYIAIEMAFLPTIVGMEINGMGIDIHRLIKYVEVVENKNKEQVEAVHKEYNVDPLSQAQCGKVLEAAGVKVEKTDKDHYSLKDDFLLGVEHPLAAKIYEIRTSNRDLQRAKKLIEYSNNERVRCEFDQFAGINGFVSSSNPPLGNNPKTDWWRSIFVAPAKKKMVCGDFPQIELRIEACFVNDKAMIEAYKNRSDLHRETAMWMTKKKTEDVLDSERKAAKATNFGVIYNISPNGLIKSAKEKFGVELKYPQADKFIASFKERFKEIALHIENTKKYFEKNKSQVVHSLAGRPMVASTVYEALNYPVSGTKIELLKMACVFYRRKVSEKNIKVWMDNVISDEIVSEALENSAEEAAKALKDSMFKAAQVLKVPLYIDEIDVRIKNDWSQKGEGIQETKH